MVSGSEAFSDDHDDELEDDHSIKDFIDDSNLGEVGSNENHAACLNQQILDEMAAVDYWEESTIPLENEIEVVNEEKQNEENEDEEVEESFFDNIELPLTKDEERQIKETSYLDELMYNTKTDQNENYELLKKHITIPKEIATGECFFRALVCALATTKTKTTVKHLPDEQIKEFLGKYCFVCITYFILNEILFTF